MYEEHESAPTSPGRLPCPECGKAFNPRGIAGHRRLKHGVGWVQSSSESTATVPLRPQPTRQLDVLLVESLGAIQLLLERMDSRLERMETALVQNSGGLAVEGQASTERAASEQELLRNELKEVFREIAQAKSVARRDELVLSGLDGANHTVEDPEGDPEEVSSMKLLGHLRRRQADILYRMASLSPELSPVELGKDFALF